MNRLPQFIKATVEYYEEFNKYQLIIFYTEEHHYIKLFDTPAEAFFFAAEHPDYDFGEEQPR